MKMLLLILLFLPIAAFSQKDLDFGQVKGVSISECKDFIKEKVCASNNQLDIFLTSNATMIGRYKTVHLSYNGLKWAAIGYEGDLIHHKIDSFILKPVFSFDSIFASLKSNKIFTLPNQYELKYNWQVDDGVEYNISFKAGDKFRSYQFDNPEDYSEHYKDIPEFTYYTRIVQILFKWFSKK